ncbi:MAG: thermonuclease family protein [Cyanobacteria bacterium SBLK]|nr:thermonuclease family protein [Cyanobacteria bacterium SBLK]
MQKIPFIARAIAGMAIALALFAPQPLKAQTASAVVHRIVDGDTVILKRGATEIRGQLACIDAPDWIDGQPQTHAQTAKNRLNALMPVGSSVRYRNLGTISSGDRTLVEIFHNNRNINVQMVAAGLARLHSRYRQTCPDSSDRLAEAQKQAADRRLGIWIH